MALLSIAELLAMALWFSASAVVPQLTTEWELSAAGQSWLTMSVQLGFVVGALTSAALNLADRIPVPKLLAASAVLGAVANALIVVAPGFESVVGLRFATGFALAGVYPPGMKLVASWCREDRGLCIGVLVGALTIGSASPHLVAAYPAGPGAWRFVLITATGLALIGAFISGAFVRSGPYLSTAQQFSWRHAADGLAYPPTRLANFGYLGHMWELYAMWTWAPVMLLVSYEAAGWSSSSARVAGFGLIAAGGIGSLVAGRLADRFGRTTVTSASLIVSGACAVLVGLLFAEPLVLTVVCLVWGFAVVADSAQFSAAISELTDARYVGTALTMQTCMGFLLSMVTIRLVPSILELVGWRWVFLFLVLGPIAALVSMLRLRALPEAARMAMGKK